MIRHRQRRARSEGLRTAWRRDADQHPQTAVAVESTAVLPVPGLARSAPDRADAATTGGTDAAIADLPRAAVDPLGGGPVPHSVLSALRARRGAGDPLPPGVIAPMERELRRDLSSVRVHTDPGADRLTRSVPSPPVPGPTPVFGPSPAPGPVGADDGAVRRRFSVSSVDVNALRSKAGVRKGARTRDTLDKIGRLLDQHPARRDELEIIQSLLTIGALGNHWLDKHRAEQDWDKINLVETIVAEASRDHAQLLAQRRYVADARAGSGLGGPTDPRASSTPLTMQVNDSPAAQAGKLAIAARAPRVADQHRAPAVDLVAALGLTEAEILAIKTFTNEDYKYMNPAIVGDDVWMGDQQPALQSLFSYQAQSSFGRHGDVQADLRKLKSEGVLHGGVLMQAVAKLEPKVGKVYRGERLTQAEFDQKYAQGTVNFKTFASMSTEAGVGRGFSIRLPNRKNQTLSVFCEFDVIDARDISMLSVNHAEKEWLLLPGATFAVTAVKDITAGQKPVDGITRWLEVRLRQTAMLRRI